MYGFLDGPHGVFCGNFVVITDEIMDGFRNTGGALLGLGHLGSTSTQVVSCSRCTRMHEVFLFLR